MKVVFVVGTRPNFMKMAPILRAVRAFKKIKPVLVHTGQHYDFNMSETFFRDLGIPRPHVRLNAGSGSHAAQTAEIMRKFEKVLLKEKPVYVVVVGDVNSTLACALAASKLQIKVAHVESGFRSFDMRMPEEINRIVTDRLSHLLFTPQPEADSNLRKEGVPRDRIFQVGDVMIDNLLYELKKLKKRPRTRERYAILTLHRAGNVDDKKALERILRAVNRIAEKIPVYFSVHPRTCNRMRRIKLKLHPSVRQMEPLGYRQFLALYLNAQLVLTDSGGVQLETSVLNIPCLTLRGVTERLSTVRYGTNILVGTEEDRIVREAVKILDGKRKKVKAGRLGEGKAAGRIVKILWEHRKDPF